MKSIAEMKRIDFLKGAVASLGCGALGCTFGFPQSDDLCNNPKPNLVFGVISDTHLRTLKSRPPPRPWWPDTFLRTALGYFRAANVDAVVHCGDMANYGEVEAMQMHANVWNEIFPNSRAPDGHVVEKLFVTGNHDAEGENANKHVRELYSDPAIRAREGLSADMAGNWERIWGEPYEDVWHKVVKGYDFFGAHWKVDRMRMMKLVKKTLLGKAADAQGIPQPQAVREADALAGVRVPPKPFFLLTHSRLLPPERNAISAYKDRALAFFGHNHESSTNWNTIFYEPNTFPRIQVPPCISPDWDLKFRGEANVTKFPLLGKEKAGRCRQGFLVEVYDDKIVIKRREFAEGGSLGPDWILPLWECKVESVKCKVERMTSSGGARLSRPHPFEKEELKKIIGCPQFKAGAKLALTGLTGLTGLSGALPQTPNPNNLVNPVKNFSEASSLCVRIPLADGNPDSRVYAYEVEVVGRAAPCPPQRSRGDRPTKLVKATYAAGCNMGIGHETDGGVTTLLISADELPPGDELTVAVRPLSSLGTSGSPLVAKVRRNSAV